MNCCYIREAKTEWDVQALQMRSPKREEHASSNRLFQQPELRSKRLNYPNAR